MKYLKAVLVIVVLLLAITLYFGKAGNEIKLKRAIVLQAYVSLLANLESVNKNQYEFINYHNKKIKLDHSSLTAYFPEGAPFDEEKEIKLEKRGDKVFCASNIAKEFLPKPCLK